MKSKPFLLGCMAGLCAGVLATYMAIGWTVLRSNGVRDLALIGMSQQADVMRRQATELHQCRIAVPKATNRQPKRFRL